MDAGATQVGCLCVCQAPWGPGGFLSPFPRASRNCLPLLVEVNVVRPRVPPPRPAGVGWNPSGRSTLASPRRRKNRQLRGEEEALLHVAGLAGPNLEGKRLRSRNQAAWEAEAGFARWRFSSAIMVRQTWSARRRFRHRLASRSVLPSAIFVR